MNKPRDDVRTFLTEAGAARPPEVTGKSGAPAPSSATDISAFLSSARQSDPTVPRGRLIFALDATMSRQPTWDRAVHLQAEMFDEAGKIGGLDVQLVFFRGFGECRASKFVRDARALADLMTRIDCRGGRTQIERVLGHAANTSKQEKVAVVVYVGDAAEEPIDALAHKAGELALYGTKVFLFQEGRDPSASAAFAEIARITKGAHLTFESGSAGRLGELLRAAAVYASGGIEALQRMGSRNSEAAALIAQMR